VAEDTSKIFISYRRDESAAYAGRIADSFVAHYGDDSVFRDIDSMEPGLDFPEALTRAVESSAVLIAVIGKSWLTATDAASHKRLENPDDYVRLEIATALERDIRVIPLLIQGGVMPRAEDLPEDLAPLTRRNAFELHDSSWKEQVQRLMTTLDKVLGRKPAESQEDLTLRVEQLRAELEARSSEGEQLRDELEDERYRTQVLRRRAFLMGGGGLLLGVALGWFLWVIGFFSAFGY
jgi:hypothetical protein